MRQVEHLVGWLESDGSSRYILYPCLLNVIIIFPGDDAYLLLNIMFAYFFQDDAHIFCTMEQVCDNCFLSANVEAPFLPIFLFELQSNVTYLQVKEEVKGVLEFIDYVYKIFGFTYDLKLSTVPYLKISSPLHLPNLKDFA